MLRVIGPVPDRRGAANPPAPYVPPTRCPSCGTELVTGSEQGMLYCPNFDCPARQLEGLVHFASRGAMDIRGLSYARSEEHTSELQSLRHLVCRLLLEKKKQ